MHIRSATVIPFLYIAIASVGITHADDPKPAPIKFPEIPGWQASRRFDSPDRRGTLLEYASKTKIAGANQRVAVRIPIVENPKLADYLKESEDEILATDAHQKIKRVDSAEVKYGEGAAAITATREVFTSEAFGRKYETVLVLAEVKGWLVKVTYMGSAGGAKERAAATEPVIKAVLAAAAAMP